MKQLYSFIITCRRNSPSFPYNPNENPKPIIFMKELYLNTRQSSTGRLYYPTHRNLTRRAFRTSQQQRTVKLLSHLVAFLLFFPIHLYEACMMDYRDHLFDAPLSVLRPPPVFIIIRRGTDETARPNKMLCNEYFGSWKFSRTSYLFFFGGGTFLFGFIVILW